MKGDYKMKEEKVIWESQKLELTHKNKLYQRKINELDERLSEIIHLND